MAKGTGLKFYIDDRGDHRWRAQAANGRIQGDSGEGYRRRGACEAGAVATALAILQELQPSSLVEEVRGGALH